MHSCLLSRRRGKSRGIFGHWNRLDTCHPKINTKTFSMRLPRIFEIKESIVSFEKLNWQNFSRP
uniref:Testis cDNA clone: QtsA-12480, similar to human IQ motif containing GTPase activating protein 2(IQGAP2) n=1 Tax=Macaca fascicularis TaxID=9541 RepID=Q4R446_MACFA|nr:unnamed protein product [Macaca fascicularis]